MIAKKVAYATLGGLMLTVAALTRTFAEGGIELMLLVVVGIVLLVASADLPQQHQKGSAR